MIPVAEQEPGVRFGRPVNLQSWKGGKGGLNGALELNKGQKQFANNQTRHENEVMERTLMKNVRNLLLLR